MLTRVVVTAIAGSIVSVSLGTNVMAAPGRPAMVPPANILGTK